MEEKGKEEKVELMNGRKGVRKEGTKSEREGNERKGEKQ